MQAHHSGMTLFRHRAQGPGSAGDVWSTTLWSNGAASLAATHTAWQTFVSSFISGTLGAMWPNEYSITDLITDQVDTSSHKNTAQVRSSVSYVGTGAGATPSPRAALVIGLRTALPTKAGRGRMYWLSPDSSHYTATGLFVGADLTTIANGFGTALTTFKATSQPVVVHIPTSGGITFDSITYAAASSIPGTQRRRTNRVAGSYATKTI